MMYVVLYVHLHCAWEGARGKAGAEVVRVTAQFARGGERSATDGSRRLREASSAWPHGTCRPMN